MLHADLSEKIIRAYYRVYNELGYGFLEKVYENSMVIALRDEGLIVEQQCPITVYSDGQVVGEYFADLLVGETFLIEIKAAEAISPSHGAQLLNYLKATKHELGLLMNFGPKPEFRRKIMSNP